LACRARVMDGQVRQAAVLRSADPVLAAGLPAVAELEGGPVPPTAGARGTR
jgi:hypothetical protein